MSILFGLLLRRKKWVEDDYFPSFPCLDSLYMLVFFFTTVTLFDLYCLPLKPNAGVVYDKRRMIFEN